MRDAGRHHHHARPRSERLGPTRRHSRAAVGPSAQAKAANSPRHPRSQPERHGGGSDARTARAPRLPWRPRIGGTGLEGVPLRDARLLLISSVLALVSIGLLLSLLPPTSFVSRAADDIVDAVGPVWPEQSVEQGLAPGLAVVSEIRIWGAAGPGQGEAPVVAALLQGPDRELVRQVKVSIKASNFPQPHILGFAPYRPVSGEELILQLWVSTERSNHAIFGTNEPREGIAGPTINLNPTDQGPLAYELIWRGDGWRAALEGSWSDALRLAGGMAAAVLAASLHPRLLGRYEMRCEEPTPPRTSSSGQSAAPYGEHGAGWPCTGKTQRRRPGAVPSMSFPGSYLPSPYFTTSPIT